MQTFSPGDLVTCVDPGLSDLVRGQEYEVLRRDDETYAKSGPAIWLKGHDTHPYLARRFRLVPMTVDYDDGVFTRTRAEPAPASGFDKLSTAEVQAQPGIPAEPPAGLPDGNPKTRFGLAKPPIALIPGPALIHMADAFRDGAGKYGPANWRNDPVTTSTYVNAALRHILAYYDGEQVASDSGVHHLGHAAGCLAILLDAEAQGTLNDDRPTAGKTSELIAAKTKPLA